MGFPTKVQLIKRKASEQWYINFPSALAQAMEFERGETVEWVIEDKSQLVLRRRSASATTPQKKGLPGLPDVSLAQPVRFVPAGLRPAADFRARPRPWPIRAGLLGPPHPVWAPLRVRAAVSRLVGRLPSL